MSSPTFARAGFAAGLAGLGLLSLLNGDFALAWQPVPPDLPFRVPLAYLSGAILLGGGSALLVPRTSRVAAWLLAAFMLSWLLLLQAPRVVASPLDVGAWLGFAETMVLVTGGWMIAIVVSRGEADHGRGRFVSTRSAATARILYAVALPLIGLSHFKYAEATASMIPTWIPGRLFFAYLTGAGHVAAGVALLLGLVPRLAAEAEATMISGFVVLLHVPAVIAEPGSRLQWTMLCVATALASGCWAIASSYNTVRWFERCRPTKVRMAGDSNTGGELAARGSQPVVP
jgi:uncharacterized membrane protein